MAKFVTVFVLFSLIALAYPIPVIQRDVEEIYPPLVDNSQGVLGNGILGKDAQIIQENFERNSTGSYVFALVFFIFF